MYSQEDAPMGSDASVISVMIDAIPVNSGGTHTVGVVITTDASLEQQLPAEILDCQDSVKPHYQARFFNSPSQIIFTHEVITTGPQFVLIMVCPKVDVSQSAVRLLGTVAFRNPYGYLAASSFPFLPFYGVLCAVYIVTTGIYFLLALAFKRNLTPLHYGTLAVFVFGVLEVVCMFLLYLQLNFSGFPVCCPLRPLAILSVVLNAMKRSGSRALILSVALGFSVTTDHVKWRTKASLGVLSIAYFAAAVVKDIEIDTNAVPSGMDTWLMLPVTILDVIFVVWFYIAIVSVCVLCVQRVYPSCLPLLRCAVCTHPPPPLTPHPPPSSSQTNTKSLLENTAQTSKLAMYQKLTVAIGSFVVIWCLMAVYSIAVGKGFVNLAWQNVWLLHSFWHLAYYAILTSISLIWTPSKTSNQLAYSFQLAMDEDEADLADEYLDGVDAEFGGSDGDEGGDEGMVDIKRA